MAISQRDKDDINERGAFKDVPEKKERDMRPPSERGNNLFRDNPPEKSDPRSIFRSNG